MLSQQLNFLTAGKKIVGIGRNYKAHALELGNAVPTKYPIFFLKPTSSYLPYSPSSPSHNTIILPPNTDIHHEVELGVVIGKKGAHIPRGRAFDHVMGYTLSLDMTARNMQKQAQKSGDPWTIAKGYDTFTPTSGLIPPSAIPDPHNLRLWCKVGGQMKQDGQTSDMIFDIPFLVEYVSSVMTLEPGDLILTGTPAGVGSIRDGQEIECGLELTGGSGNEKPLAHIKFTAKQSQ